MQKSNKASHACNLSKGALGEWFQINDSEKSEKWKKEGAKLLGEFGPPFVTTLLLMKRTSDVRMDLCEGPLRKKLLDNLGIYKGEMR